MKIKYLFFLAIISSLFAFNIHKLYVSICHIEYVKKQETVQITVSIFIDDLELVLNKKNKIKLNIATKIEKNNIDVYFQEYLQNHLKIKLNNNPTNFIYIGKEYDDDLVRFYLEITSIKYFSSFEISNTILLSEFEDQKNIIKIKIEKEHKTIYLDRENTKGMLKF